MRTFQALIILPILAFYSELTFSQEFNLVGNKPPVAAPQPVVPAVDGGTEIISPEEPVFALASTSPAAQPPIAQGADKYEVPPTEIGGADTVYPLGEMVQLWIKPIAKRPEFLESVAYSWTVLPGRKVVVWPDSTRILFGTGIQNGAYTVILTASYVYIEPAEDNGKPTIAQRAVTKLVQVKVGTGEGPPPGDGSGDEPGNGPGDPGLNGLSKSAYDWTAFVEVDPDYGQDKVRQDAAVLANNFAQIAKEIDDGQLTRVTDIINRTKALNDNGTVNRNAWLPWFTKMSEFLNTAYNNGTVKTPAQFSEAWKEISQGLAAAAQ